MSVSDLYSWCTVPGTVPGSPDHVLYYSSAILFFEKGPAARKKSQKQSKGGNMEGEEEVAQGGNMVPGSKRRRRKDLKRGRLQVCLAVHAIKGRRNEHTHAPTVARHRQIIMTAGTWGHADMDAAHRCGCAHARI